MTSVSGILKEFGRVMDDIETNCGTLGTECLNLNDSFNIFMFINLFMLKNNFYPIGNYILVDNTIIQQYGKQNFTGSPDISLVNSYEDLKEVSNQTVITEGIKKILKINTHLKKNLRKTKRNHRNEKVKVYLS